QRKDRQSRRSSEYWNDREPPRARGTLVGNPRPDPRQELRRGIDVERGLNRLVQGVRFYLGVRSFGIHSNRSFNCLRALNKRDFTVPWGISSNRATSLTSCPSTLASTITMRSL